jgi:hypothetical protein
VLDRPSDLEPVSGFEPLTVRLQGGCSAKLSYTGRLIRIASTRNPSQVTGSGVFRLTDTSPPPADVASTAARENGQLILVGFRNAS